MRRSWFVLLGLLGSVAFLALPVVASAGAATVTHDEPVDFVTFNSCAGEDVHVIGTARFTDQFTVLPTGKIHIVHIGNVADVTAIGATSGTVYNPTGQPEVFVFNYDPNSDSGPYNFHNRQLFITPGGADNFVLKESFHVEQTPNGDTVVVNDGFTIECRG